MKNALVLQCGGPTAVINASLAAVIAGWRDGAGGGGGEIFGGRHGLRALPRGDWLPLGATSDDALARLALQPGAALGSGRHLLQEAEFAAALDHLAGAGIGTLFLIGGNGTMAAAQHLAERAQGALQVVGIPKTVDNDVAGTEVAPGYLSAANFAVRSVRDAGLDLRAMQTFDDVSIVEVMGRHSGWLTAAAGLAAQTEEDAPHVLVLPERLVGEDALLERIATVHARFGVCMVAASEGARDAEGNYLAEKFAAGGSDARGQRLLSLSGGVAAYLAQVVRERLNLRCRQTRPDTLYRSSSALAHPLDRELARMAAVRAVALARAGETLVMAGLAREDGTWTTRRVPFAEVVGQENPLAAAMIADDGFGITPVFRAWMAGMVDRPVAAVDWSG